jgi:hypothetical protein
MEGANTNTSSGSLDIPILVDSKCLCVEPFLENILFHMKPEAKRNQERKLGKVSK